MLLQASPYTLQGFPAPDPERLAAAFKKRKELANHPSQCVASEVCTQWQPRAQAFAQPSALVCSLQQLIRVFVKFSAEGGRRKQVGDRQYNFSQMWSNGHTFVASLVGGSHSHSSRGLIAPRCGALSVKPAAAAVLPALLRVCAEPSRALHRRGDGGCHRGLGAACEQGEEAALLRLGHIVQEQVVCKGEGEKERRGCVRVG